MPRKEERHLAATAAVLTGIRERLVRGGFLAIGAHESLPKPAAGLERCADRLPILRKAGWRASADQEEPSSYDAGWTVSSSQRSLASS